MPETENFNVEADRLNFLKELRERVDSAIANRKKVRLIPSGRTDFGSASKSGRQGSILAELHGNRKVNLGTPGDEPHEVSVDNPHDYRALLKYSFSKVLPLEAAQREVEETLNHEFEHHVPGLDQGGLNMKYSVDFVEDVKTGRLLMTPHLSLSGSTRAGVVRRVFEGVSDESRTDEIFLRKK